MIDDDGVAFNPFNIGPPNNGNRHTYEIPSSPTYPPPVYATWPPPKDHTNKSVSQGTLAKERSTTGAVVFKTASSQIGQMAISRAINEDMAAAKQQVGEEERINAGSVSKTGLPQAASRTSCEVQTLMPVRLPRSASKYSMSQMSAVSAKRSPSQLSMAKSVVSRTTNIVPSKMRTGSTTTLNSAAQLKKSQKSSNLNKIETARDSHISLRYKAGENHADNISRGSHKSDVNVRVADNVSRVSLKSQANNNQADKISRLSIRSKIDGQQAENISRVSVQSRHSLRSQANDNQADKTSRLSIRPMADAQQTDNISRISVQSRHSLRSQANDNQADKTSRLSIRPKTDNKQADNISRDSEQSQLSQTHDRVDNEILKTKKDTMKPLHNIVNTELPLRQRADLVKKELSQSMETSNSLSLKAAELSARLRAGTEYKHNRFHSVMRMCSNSEPLKRFRDDRMSLWFKDSVLS